MKKVNFKKLMKIKIVVVDELPDLSNDPFFKKKLQDAKDFFERTGIPDFVTNPPEIKKKKK